MKELEKLKRPFVLASRSPRRREILSQMGLFFETEDPGLADEQSYIDPDDLENSLRFLASAKAESIARRRPHALVLGADTVVVKGRKVLGKAADKSEAAHMLGMLSGSQHTVITAAALICAEKEFAESVAVKTSVFFRDLSEKEIQSYLSMDEYRDKAGAYAIQGRAMIFIDKIEGCYYNVVGLPVTATLNLIQQFVRKESIDVRSS
ncbi:MAG: Maf family protein [Chitinispirillaceae bacterium]